MRFNGSPFGGADVDLDQAIQTIGGKVFYVNSAGGGADDIDTPWPPIDNSRLCFDTLQKAIDATVADRGDVIFVKRGYTTITTAVLFNKQGISVIGQRFGMPGLYRGEYFAQDAAAVTDGPAMTISYACYIEGLGFHTAWTGGISSIGLVELVSGSSGWVHLKNVRFMNWGTATVYGINCEAGANMVFEECSFEGNASQGFVNAGIAFGGSATQNPIRNRVTGCVFSNCTYAIEHKDGKPQEFLYDGNFTVPGDVATKFLNTNALAATGMVARNSFYTAVGNGTFSDADAATVEALGIKLVGNEYATEDPGPT
jgi:hypothetical protein